MSPVKYRHLLPLFLVPALMIALAVGCRPASNVIPEEALVDAPTPTASLADFEAVFSAIYKPYGWSEQFYSADIPDHIAPEALQGSAQTLTIDYKDRSREPVPSLARVTVLFYTDELAAKNAFDIWYALNANPANPRYRSSRTEGPQGQYIGIITYAVDPEDPVLPAIEERRFLVQTCRSVLDYTFTISEIGEIVDFNTQQNVVQQTAQALTPIVCAEP